MTGGAINLFSPSLWKKHYSLYPVVVICGAGCALAGGYVTYMLATKSDLSLRPSSWKDHAPYKFVDPHKTQRLMKYTNPIEVDPAVVALRKEIGSYQTK